MSQPEIVRTVSLQTDDFEELQMAATDWDQQYCQMSPGPFEGGIEMAQVGSRQIFRERWGKKIRYQGTAPRGSFGFALPLDQPGLANWVGMEAGSNTVVLQAPGQEADLVSSDYWDALVFGISEQEVHSIVSALSDHHHISDECHGIVTLKPDVAEKFRRIGLDFLRMSKLASSQEEIDISRWSEQIVKLFLWELVKAREGPQFLIKPPKPANTVRQVTELVLSDQTSGIGLTDICTQLDVSLRTLHYAFQDVTGMSPATWLRRIRLNQAYKTLLRSAPDEVLIKQVAIDSGFIHCGHFSRQYKNLFGCLPSQTLQSP